jgi:hypothetical protein
MRSRIAALALAAAAIGACLSTQKQPPVPKSGADAGADAGPIACRPCLSNDDCTSEGACLQFAGSDYCARRCEKATECSGTEACAVTILSDGTQATVCLPTSGTCADIGCGTCAQGTTCNWILGMCQPLPSGSICGALIGPGYDACCHCGSGSNCDKNGCYGGWWCDTSTCTCTTAPIGDCSSGDAGIPSEDAGIPTGTVTAAGGQVSRLFFAVVGDTRPGSLDRTDRYPTATIQKIFQDIQDMSPRPQFVLATGDFVYASPEGGEAAKQLVFYTGAAQLYSGPVFPAMGNHECDGYTADNCAGAPTASLAAFKSALLTPINQASDYFTINFQAQDGSWTAKLIVLACNDWDDDQRVWFAQELAKPTTHTLVARHEPTSASNAPCVKTSDALLATAKYDLLLVGHTHTFAHSGKQFIVGISGAPLSGGGNWGYATVEQFSGGFMVRQYDYETALPVNASYVPFSQ